MHIKLSRVFKNPIWNTTEKYKWKSLQNNKKWIHNASFDNIFYYKYNTEQ